MLVTMKADEHAFAHQDDILSKFVLILGLTINRDKSVITSIGKHCDPLLSAINYKWSNGQFHYLGFLLSKDDRNITSLNVDPMIFDFEDCFRYHKCASISLWGRVIVVKFLVATKFVYPSSFLPMPDRYVFQAIQDNIVDYIWMDGRHKMSYQCLIQPIDKGGIQAVDIKTQSIALKFSILNGACYDDKQFWAKHVRCLFLIPLRDVLIAYLTYTDLKKLLRKKAIMPEYWSDVFQQWCHCHYRSSNSPISRDQLAKMPIKFN